MGKKNFPVFPKSVGKFNSPLVELALKAGASEPMSGIRFSFLYCDIISVEDNNNVAIINTDFFITLIFTFG